MKDNITERAPGQAPQDAAIDVTEDITTAEADVTTNVTTDAAADGQTEGQTDAEQEAATQKRSKANIAVNVIFWVIIALALVVLIMVVVARVQNKNVSFFGYSFAIVVTDSMEPEIETGSLIVVKECGISADYVGQNVVFISQSGDLAGQSVVHKAIEYYEQDGEIYLVTQGVGNIKADDDPVTADNFVGLCVASNYALGVIVNFLVKYGVPIVIALIAIPVIVKLVIYIVKTARKDGEDTENKE